MSRFHEFAGAEALAEAMADRVAATLSEAIGARGRASIAVSGGTTPGRFFDALSTRPLDWDKVDVTLVDERFVPFDNPRSNHALVAGRLLKNAASAAHFLPLYQPEPTAEAAAATASRTAGALAAPFDVVVLGMGGDGHTASFFPGGSHLSQALDMGTDAPILSMEADGAGEPRLTFSFRRLQDARLLILHIEGEAKRSVLEKAQAGHEETEMPVRAVLRRAATEVDIYWAP
ncbi:6-phosphogluconolactonase [Gellertiella hungarica]|uniref:6-phosphogluconolactonase n=1 Tax=Gellertiella hungarica TaxID=1572859 RepID=A0A7W6J3M6_9HYPH|nr:6-phosphogluconolactonase [Gellertiella hungarica]MBB4064159.1 6-phosphogluconolactonase [Gellertiella hungarica]